MESNENINELREHRKNIREKFESLTTSVEDMLNTFNLDDGKTMITFNDMKRSKLNEILKVNNKVSFKKYCEGKNILKFKAYLKPGGKFGLQKHDCLEEVFIVQGNLIESLREHKEYKKGDTVTYKQNELHKPYATEDSIYKVIFMK